MNTKGRQGIVKVCDLCGGYKSGSTHQLIRYPSMGQPLLVVPQLIT